MMQWLKKIMALLSGLVVGFFLVLNALFSDSNGNVGERLVTFGLVLVAFGLLGAFFGYLKTASAWGTSLLVGLPTTILAILYAIKDGTGLGLAILYSLIVVGAAFLGGRLFLHK